MKEPLFSIFMCARNAEITIKKAIESVLMQTCQDWELLIVDNGSKDMTWKIIQDMMEIDSRVRGFHLENGIGWPKGSSLCLKHAVGKYMTFLSADDFLISDGGLYTVKKYVENEKPDIAWVGHIELQMKENGYQITGGIVPEYKVYFGNDKVNEIFEIMNNLYYNSFFHYINIDFLRNNRIDFYEPFYADYEGVTEALCRAEKMVVLDQRIYALSLQTSQTSGEVTWKVNDNQWKSIKKAVCEKGCYNYEKLHYIAIRILKNNLSMLKGICEGLTIRDLEMNPLGKTSLERLQYIEEILENSEYDDMFYYAGKRQYTKKILDCVKFLYEQCKQEGFSEERIAENVKWIDRLVKGFYQWNGDKLLVKNTFDIESCENIRYALCKNVNQYMFGYELLEQMDLGIMQEHADIFEDIAHSYIKYCLKRIYKQLFLAVEIKRRNRIEEVIDIVRECTEILQKIREYLTEQELITVLEDLKMIASNKIK